MKLLLSQTLPNIASNDKFYRHRTKFIIESHYPNQSQDSNTKCDLNKFLSHPSNIKHNTINDSSS